MSDDPKDQAGDHPAKTGGKKVLDLLDDQKPSRGERRRKELEEAEKRRRSVDEAKKNALNLFEEEEKPKKARKKAVRETGSALPSIGAESAKPSGVADPIADRVRGGSLEDLVKNLAGGASKPAAPAATKDEAPDTAPADEGAGDGGEDATDEEPGEGGEDKKIISIKGPIVLKDLAELMGLRPFHLIKDLMEMEVFGRPDTVIEVETAEKICATHGFEVERERREKGGGVHKEEEVVEEPPAPVEEPEEEMQLRAPIITFMGHVDHGKTSLLDAIRQTNVTKGEAGGITQHIGAYNVVHNDQPITFLDTPGHAIFTEMRSRGANVTDIVVLVVAADDGFMPQTDEALNHARAAGVTIMVAANKIDLPAANLDRVRTQMQERDLSPEDWGGDTVLVPVSAHSGEGIPHLLDLMALQAEVMELKANPRGLARASVIEARLETGRGATATVIVNSGTLKAGTPFICGPYAGKVKSLTNDRGERVEQVGPGYPVEVVGFSGLPNVGDEVVEMKNDRLAKKLSEERIEELRTKKLSAPKRARLENLLSAMEEGGSQTFRLVLKGDVQGSVEAIASALGEIESDKIDLNILHSGVGPISDNDVLLASASDAIVLGFNVKLESNAVKTAKREGVQVKLYSIVYELIDQVKEAMQGMLEPETRESRLGEARVLKVFKVKRGKAAGCYVEGGRIDRRARARVTRDGQVVYDGPIGTLRRFQDDVNEVKAGTECGLRLGDYNEYEEGDIIECYKLEKVAQEL